MNLCVRKLCNERHDRLLPVTWQLCALWVTVWVLQSCSGSGSGAGISTPSPELLADEISQGQQATPEVLLTLARRDDLLTEVPEVVSTYTRADTGLQVSYTAEEQQQQVPANLVEQHWVHMLDCVQQLAPSPLILVRTEAVKPFSVNDDVVRNIESRPMASASPTEEGTVVQMSVLDFDGSQGNAGFYLRSILGRYLWLAAGLAERDYPFHCARTVLPESR